MIFIDARHMILISFEISSVLLRFKSSFKTQKPFLRKGMTAVEAKQRTILFTNANQNLITCTQPFVRNNNDYVPLV